MDIKITGMNTIRSQRSSERSDRFTFFFKLSRQPSDEWLRQFDTVRMDNFHIFTSTVGIDGQELSVECDPDEIESVLDSLKADVAATNKAVKIEQDRKANEDAIRKSRAEQDAETIARIAAKLKFE